MNTRTRRHLLGGKKIIPKKRLMSAGFQCQQTHASGICPLTAQSDLAHLLKNILRLTKLRSNTIVSLITFLFIFYPASIIKPHTKNLSFRDSVLNLICILLKKFRVGLGIVPGTTNKTTHNKKNKLKFFRFVGELVNEKKIMKR